MFMSHLVETMAYANSVPWHGLGNPVSDSLTPHEMMVAAELDWTVSRRKIMTECGLKTNDWHLLVRDSDNQILGPCGKNYVPIQNAEVFSFFDKFVKAGNMKMETAGSLDNGRQVWGLAAINKGFCLPGGDEVNGYLLFSQPHIWGKSMNIMFTPIRVVCNNTLTMALGQKADRFTMSHVRAFDDDVAQRAELALGLATHQLDAFKVTSELLARVAYEEKQVTKYITQLFQPQLLDVHEDRTLWAKTADEVYNCIHTQPGAVMSEGTWWSALNAVTYYVDHKAGRERDASLQSAWFGPRAALKRKALNLAVEYAQAA
jgi:phage/plasmid-like protein (TIGR03299 family)